MSVTLNKKSLRVVTLGLWFERDITFDASLMKQGSNSIKLTVPAGNAYAGIEYDYLRLELDENAK